MLSITFLVCFNFYYLRITPTIIFLVCFCYCVSERPLNLEQCSRTISALHLGKTQFSFQVREGDREFSKVYNTWSPFVYLQVHIGISINVMYLSLRFVLIWYYDSYICHIFHSVATLEIKLHSFGLNELS